MLVSVPSSHSITEFFFVIVVTFSISKYPLPPRKYELQIDDSSRQRK